MSWGRWKVITFLAAVSASCSSPSNNGGADTGESSDAGHITDAAPTDGGPDAARDTGAEPDTASDMPVTPGGPIVEVDLEPYLGEAGEGSSRIVRAEENVPFSGPVIQGRAGDWIIENDIARFLIEGDNRVMSPCPWGGTIVDAADLRGGGDEDILGEICMLVNGGQTFRPDRFDVLADGSDGRAAVLAASGGFVVNDFLNLPTMVGDYLSGLEDVIQIDINRSPPLRVTVYYILRPGESAVHVLTAMRNDTDVQEDLLPVFLVASGGDGEYYNPASTSGGFGSGGGSLGVALDNFPFIAFRGDTASYAFAPQLDEDLLPRGVPVAGSYLIISGVAATLLGADSSRVIPLLSSSPEALAASDEALHVSPGETEVIEHRVFVGGGAISDLVDPIYETMGVELGTLQGVVHDADGSPVAGARVTAVRTGRRAMNQAITGADGSFRMKAPPETYELTARKGGGAPLDRVSVTLEANETVDVEGLTVKLPAKVVVRVTTPDDGCGDTADPSPVPARLTVVCVETPCPDAARRTEYDTDKNSLPDNFAGVYYGGVDGVLEAEIPAGEYRLVVDRGMEWSTWPSHAPRDGGFPVTLADGEEVEFDVEIARVLETPSAISGDFHVHSITSPDSPVPWDDRVRNFMAEGVDVIVATDHDYVSDYRHVVDELGASSWIQTIVGDEITTADLGHFNAFPLTADPSHARGGALDWGNGDDYTLLPAEMFAAIRGMAPSDPVIQVNHAEGLGFVRNAKADVLRGISYADRGSHRLPPAEPDPQTGDTGIWSDDFTAMEILNGSSRARFNILGRWWMTMIGRGFAPTGTAVSDTHKLYGDLGGVPRTYVFGDAEVSCGDRPFAELTDYDAFVAEFTRDINAGRALGTNGPFFTVTVENGAGEMGTLGDTITADDETRATLEIQTPEWMQVSTVDVYLNPDPDDVITRPAEPIEAPIPPTESIALTWDEPSELVTVETGGVEHRAWRKTITIPLQTDADAFVIFVVHGEQSMWPIHGSAPFAFSNPVFLDADGNGYDNPPYAALAAQPPPPGESPCMDAFCGRIERGSEPIQPREIMQMIRHYDCKDPSHAH